MEFIRPKKASLSLDMAPLIDVVFQLLIFFMLSSSFLTPALKLTLPKAVEQDERQPERVVISVDKAGAIYLDTRPVSLERLRPLLEPLVIRNPKRVVHIRIDTEEILVNGRGDEPAEVEDVLLIGECEKIKTGKICFEVDQRPRAIPCKQLSDAVVCQVSIR